MSKVLFALLLTAGLHVARVVSFNLAMNPTHVRVTNDSQSVSFACSADVALAGCQVRWWGSNSMVGPLLELSQGSKSQAVTAHLNDKLTSYSYSGRGLGAGDCGVTLQVTGMKLWMVACRVRAESGSWKYAWGDLYASSTDWAPLRHKLTTPREAIVFPGGEARIMMKAAEPMRNCWFFVPGRSGWLKFDQGATSNHSADRLRYFGAGMESGECGLTLTDISETDNGPVISYIDTSTKKADNRFTPIIVARPPTVPTLSLVYVGSNVTATCEVQESRPVAVMSWVLGDAVIRQNYIDDTQATPQDEWKWPWSTRGIKQTLTLQLQPQDHGHVLKCLVSHVALVQPHVEKRVVSFTDSTKAEKVAKSEVADLALKSAKSSAKAEEARAKAEEARAREEIAWAQNAEEELQFERERRTKSLQHSQSSQSQQG